MRDGVPASRSRTEEHQIPRFTLIQSPDAAGKNPCRERTRPVNPGYLARQASPEKNGLNGCEQPLLASPPARRLFRLLFNPGSFYSLNGPHTNPLQSSSTPPQPNLSPIPPRATARTYRAHIYGEANAGSLMTQLDPVKHHRLGLAFNLLPRGAIS